MIIIKNAKLIENKQTFDLYIMNKRMYLLKPMNFNDSNCVVIILKPNEFVSAGWIDSHVHCNPKNQLYSAVPDNIGVGQGVTTIIDAGSIGVDELDKFFNLSQKYVTKIKCLLNISKQGIYKQSELEDINNIKLDFDQKYKDFIVGYKCRMSSSVVKTSGIKALEIFSKRRKTMPLMVHIGNEPPKFEDIITFLNKNDIITHWFNYKNNSIFEKDGKLTKAAKMAIDKKIITDVGHGSQSFDFACAQRAFENGFKVDVISSDIYDSNIKNGIVQSLSMVMSKFRAIGYSWKEIIDKVTITPATIFGLEKQGKIQNGYWGDLNIFEIKKEKIETKDSHNNKVVIYEYINVTKCFIDGVMYEVDKHD